MTAEFPVERTRSTETDRDDLDKQLGNTSAACGLDPNRATSGRNLLELVTEHNAVIVTTLIHKFDKALNVKKCQDESADIFMLIDESHRTNFGSFSARMRQMFPNACYLGFTGTPLMKKEKNNFRKFGGLIEPHYSINQAVADGAVVPLLYEGRHVEMTQNKDFVPIRLWRFIIYCSVIGKRFSGRTRTLKTRLSMPLMITFMTKSEAKMEWT